MTEPEVLRPMSKFDRAQPAIVHDGPNDELFEWVPEKHQADYDQYATEPEPGVIAWDGLLLDGWRPLDRA